MPPGPIPAGRLTLQLVLLPVLLFIPGRKMAAALLFRGSRISPILSVKPVLFDLCLTVSLPASPI
jgi:hypothetical protein